jgi:L-lactate dehydrogenase complex protein LldG
MTSAREAILQTIRTARGAAKACSDYRFPAPTENLAALFMRKAKEAEADVAAVATRDEVPAAVAAFLAAIGAPARLHVPQNSLLRALPWARAIGLAISAVAPGPEDAALAEASCAIAETGTVVFASGAQQPSSWHFLPGREIVLLPRARILARPEDVFLVFTGNPPATLNLVTGPSRTGDIEQTIERGAHGPRSVHILIYG